MLLDLRPREIALPGGITLVARPLESWAYLRWLDHGLQHLAGGPDLPEKDRLRRAAADAEAHRLAGEILSAHALRVEGLEVQDAGGRRTGTVQDLVTQGALVGHVLRAMNALLAGSVLSEADVGNSAAPRQPGAPGPVTP
jgi:hypothetical protein